MCVMCNSGMALADRAVMGLKITPPQMSPVPWYSTSVSSPLPAVTTLHVHLLPGAGCQADII